MSTQGHQQRGDGRPRRRTAAQARDLAGEAEDDESPSRSRRSPNQQGRTPGEEAPDRQPFDPHSSSSHRRAHEDPLASDSGPHSGQLTAQQLAEDGNELLSRTSLRRSRHGVLGEPPARHETPPAQSLFGNFSFASHDKAHFRTDDLLEALDDSEPDQTASPRRQRDKRSRSPRSPSEYDPLERDGPMPSHGQYGERELPSKPTWANYLDEVRHVAKTRRAPPNWDSQFTSPVLKSLFDEMKAAGRREVLQRLAGSERELPTLRDVFPRPQVSENAGRHAEDETSPRSPRSTRPTSRAEKRAALRRRSVLFTHNDSSSAAPSYAEPPRAPSPPTAPQHGYALPPRMMGGQYATSFEDVVRAERERLQGSAQAGLHDLGGLAHALDDQEEVHGGPAAAYRPRAREGELRRQMMIRRVGGDE